MKAPVSRRRGSWPTPAPITMDLLGKTPDGQLYLWQAGAKVQPMDRFPTTEGKRIAEGHYVLLMGGKAVTAYVGNAIKPGDVTVQVMCSNTQAVCFPRLLFEGDVLGRVIPDPQAQAEIRDMLRQMTDDLIARQTAPHRRRGAV